MTDGTRLKNIEEKLDRLEDLIMGLAATQATLRETYKSHSEGNGGSIGTSYSYIIPEGYKVDPRGGVVNGGMWNEYNKPFMPPIVTNEEYERLIKEKNITKE
jgi:hypothetical protein